MLGHWTFPPFDPEKYFGFTYVITCLPTGKMYVGKKNFKTKNGNDSNWKTYTSSSKDLNTDIAALGKEHFLFEIIGLYQSKELLACAEVDEQVSRNVLNERFESGERKYYNRNIHGVHFDTSGMSVVFSESRRKKISNNQRGSGNSFFGKHHTAEHKRKRSAWLSEVQAAGGFMLGKTQPTHANDARAEKLKGREPANKGKPGHSKGKVSPMKGLKCTKAVMCDNNRFESIVSAARFFNLSENSVRHRLKAPQFPTWYYIQ